MMVNVAGTLRCDIMNDGARSVYSTNHFSLRQHELHQVLRVCSQPIYIGHPQSALQI